MSRAASVMGAIVAAHPDKHVAIVSHGGLLNAYLFYLLNLPPESPVHFHSENTAITHVIIEQGQIHILRFGDDRHLEGLKESPELSAQQGKRNQPISL
jgi:broad specificity phosphatase PhoE